MPQATTIIKALASSSAIPGLLMTCMGLGLLPMDKTADIAAPFIAPLGMPIKTFLCILGPSKIMGVMSLWGYGPMPEIVGRLGLVFSALCGAYGHHVIGETPIPPVVYAGMLGSLFVLDKSTTKGKTA